jgi:hypothetical protein
MKTDPNQSQPKHDPMKTLFRSCLLAVALAAVPGAIQAQNDAHYAVGLEGIKGATLPPPGFYFRDYNVIYDADRGQNGLGQDLPGNFQALVYAQVPRVIWITDKKVFGGYFGGDVVVPIEYISLKAGPYKSSTFGLGDIYVENTLSWHPGQFDIGAAVGLNMPTGASGKPTSIGLGYWGPQLTLGVTWYADEAKTWAVSALNRYEFNSEDRDDRASDATPGQAWTLEWAVSKTLKDVCPAVKMMDLGVVGYYQQRVTSSTGNENMPNPAMDASALFPYSRVAAVGPEVNAEFSFLTASLRYNYEFFAENRMQGNTITLTLTKRF